MLNEKNNCYDYHVMTYHDTCYDTCHEGINTHVICHDSNDEKPLLNSLQLEKEGRLNIHEWWFLVDTLERWHVFNPRAIVKKNPVAAWKCMNLCKDKGVRIKGAYFTACFRTELAKEEFKKRIGVA